MTLPALFLPSSPCFLGSPLQPSLCVGSAVGGTQGKTSGKLELTSYNIESGELEAKQTIAIPDVTDEQGYMYKIHGDKVYVVPASNSSERNELPLIIINLKTGDTLYEGNITMNNPRKQDIDYNLDIHSIELDE